MPSILDKPIIPCSLRPETRDAVVEYAEALRKAAATIGEHGMDEAAFSDSGLFQSAIERIRGQQAATMAAKREFISAILDHLKDRGEIERWVNAGGGDRHDYEVILPDGTITAIEAKGCLDGQNTTVFIRPPNANEFVIWSLCQNIASDPRHNAWSGIHTRLTAEMMHNRQHVDGLIIWDGVCGTIGRICPKVERNSTRLTRVGRRNLPPPCIYLFPRTIPEPRNNPSPRCWKLKDLKFLRVLHEAFHGDANDITEVQITADVQGPTWRRTTRLVRNGVEIHSSKPTPLKRANT